MKNVVITNAVRTPIGAYLGGLKTIPVQKLAALTVNEVMKQAHLEPDMVDELIMGHVMSSAEAGNIARVVALDCGMINTPAFTVNRICASGIQAVASAYMEIITGNADIVIAAGAESLSRVPYYLPLEVRYEGFRNLNKVLKCTNEEHAKFCQPYDKWPEINSMGDTAENVVALKQITREEQDLYAFNSQMRAKKATESGRLAKEILPVQVKNKKEEFIVEIDEHMRPNTTLEALAKLKPAFRKDGSVTAGNSSGLNDASAALVVMSEEKAMELGLEPMAYVRGFATNAIDPSIMGLGPVDAIKKLTYKAGLDLKKDIGMLEINEAFAGQCLGCMKELDFWFDDPFYEKFNPHGGAVALGHPLGMTGVRLCGTVAHEFTESDIKYGIASACIGGGQGLALLLENPRA